MTTIALNPKRQVSAQRPTAAKPQTAIAQTAARVARIDSSAVQKNQQTSQGYFNRAIKMMKAVASHPVTKAALLTVAANSIMNAAGFMPAWTRPLTVQEIYGLATSGISSLINTIGGSSTLDPKGITPYETLFEAVTQTCDGPRVIKAVSKASNAVTVLGEVIEDLKIAGVIFTKATAAAVIAVASIIFTMDYFNARASRAELDELLARYIRDDAEDEQAQTERPSLISKTFNTVKNIVAHPTTKKVALFALAANSILHAADFMPAVTRLLTVQEISKVAASSINSFIQRVLIEPMRPDDFIFANPKALTMFYTPLVIWEITFGSLYRFAKNEKHREGAYENLVLVRAIYVLATSIIGTATACEYFFGKGPGA